MNSTATITENLWLAALRKRPLGLFFAPRTIAVLGASETPGSVGRALLENLHPFDGKVYPVNPHHARILREPVFARVADVPEPIDLAVIAVPAAAVLEVVRECAAAGVPAALLLTTGLNAVGAGGAELERRVWREARGSGMRIIGPGSLGLMAPHHRLNATFASRMALPGDVAFLTQSRGAGAAMLDWSARQKVGFSALVSVGSMLDVGWGDLITSLGDDPATHSIVIQMETIPEARSFLSAAREVAYSKPVIVVKPGRTERGGRAASSPSGGGPRDDAVADAAFRRAGVLRVHSTEDLFGLADVLTKQPRPSGPRLAIVTNTRGPAAMALDRLELCGGQGAVLTERTIQALDAFLPPSWSHGNPVDVLGEADADRFAQAVERVAADPNTDGVLVILAAQVKTEPRATAERLRDWARTHRGKPVLASWMGGAATEAGRRVLREAEIPVFPFPERAAEAFALMGHYSANLALLAQTPVGRTQPMDPDACRRAARLVESARRSGRRVLTAPESLNLLQDFGIPVERGARARSEKVLEEDRVLVTCGEAAEAEEGGSLHRVVATVADESRFAAVAVPPPVEDDGVELFLGSRVDPEFGPVILFGAGGRWAEELPDRAFGLPPLTSTLARDLLARTRIYSALHDREQDRDRFNLLALEDVLVRFSQLVAELPAIKEIAINPLRAAGDRIAALAARVTLHDPGVSEAALPRLAIRPYPQEYDTRAVLPDGGAVRLRAIRPEDEPTMVRFHAALSEQTVYFRYFSQLPLTSRTAHARLSRICCIDYDREVVLVALPEEGDAESIVGVGRLSKSHGKDEAEFAVVLADHWQRRGLGTLLLRKLIAIAREEHLTRVYGHILADNLGMRRLCVRLGFTLRVRSQGEIEASLHP